jgi:hypothetical protein
MTRTCRVCGETFDSIAGMNSHWQEHPEEGAPKPDMDGQTAACPQCDKAMRWRATTTDWRCRDPDCGVTTDAPNVRDRHTNIDNIPRGVRHDTVAGTLVALDPDDLGTGGNHD